MTLKKPQQGLTFIGLLFVFALLAYAGVVLAQVAPTYIEYLAVKKAVGKAAAGNTAEEVRVLFDRSAQIDDIRSIKGRDLTILRQGDRVVVSFDYTREVPLFGPAYLLMKYQGSSR